MLLHRFDAKLPVPLVPGSTPPERLLVFPLCHRKALTSPTPVVHMGREGHGLDTLRASTPMHEIDTRQVRGVARPPSSIMPSYFRVCLHLNNSVDWRSPHGVSAPLKIRSPHCVPDVKFLTMTVWT